MLGILEIWQHNSKTLGIKWADQKETYLDTSLLRASCPCASCLGKAGDSKDFLKVRPKIVQSVGRYAINIIFDDGHKTGIYTFPYLHSLPSSSS